MRRAVTRTSLTAALTFALSACAVDGVLPQAASPSAPPGTALTNGPETVLRLAATAESAGDLPGAAALYKRAHDLEPESLPTLLALGRTLAAINDPQGAANAYSMALRLMPGNLEARRGYGYALLALDQPSLAADELRQVVAADPIDARAYNGLGVALDMLGDHVVAQEQYRIGLKHAPDDTGLINNLGLSLALTGNYDESIRLLNDLVRSPAATPRSRQNLALVYGLAGRDDAAAEISRRDLDEDAVQRNLAHYARLRQLAKSERAEEALRHSTPAL